MYTLRRKSALARISLTRWWAARCHQPVALCTPCRLVSPGSPSDVAPAGWANTLRDAVASTSTRPLRPSTVAQLTDHCLQSEGRRLYAVYRPCEAPRDTPSSSSASPSDSVVLPSPDDFLLLLRVLPALGLADLYGPRVAGVFIELLRKPLHPQYGVLSPWDLSAERATALTGEALHLVAASLPGPAALAWLDEILVCRRVMPPPSSPLAESIPRHDVTDKPVPQIDLPLVCEALRERLAQYASTSSATAPITAAIALDAPGAEGLVLTPSVVACVAAALIRTESAATKKEAMTILELAASARFASESRRPLALFSEEVAVECAEAAAVVGDSETVTRLTFLLYRCRGALGVANLSERAARARQHGRAVAADAATTESASPRLWARLVAPLATTVHASWRRPGSSPPGAETGDEAGPGTEDDIRFERAAVRMLKATIRAALRHPVAASGTTSPERERDGETSELVEALALFEALRAGTSWAGTAAMVVELLTFLSSALQQQQPATASSLTARAAVHLEYQRRALYLVSVLLRGAGSPARQSDGQRRILAVCIARVMEVMLATPTSSPAIRVTGHGGGTGDNEDDSVMAHIPLVTPAQAPLLLGLFGLVDAAHQEPLLPYALAAVVAILAVPPSSLGSSSSTHPQEAATAVVRHELDSPSLHASLRALLLREPGPQLPALLRPVSRFFTATTGGASTSHDRLRNYFDATSPQTTPSVTALLLLLSLLLRAHEGSATASVEREALAALAPLSTEFTEWWGAAGAVPRGLVWQWLLQPPPPALPLRPLAGGGGGVLIDAITTVTTGRSWVSSSSPCAPHEATQMVRVLYMYTDSRARGLVDAVLTRLFGFTILTRATTDLVAQVKARATSASSRCAIVLVSASTVQASTSPWPVVVSGSSSSPIHHARNPQTDDDHNGDDDVARLRTFLQHVVESSGGGAGKSSTVVVVLTLDSLLTLPIAAVTHPATATTTTTTDVGLVGPLATALSSQLRGFAPPSSAAPVSVALEVVVLAPLDASRQALSSSSSAVPLMDGCVECTALAKELAFQLSVEQRPPLFFWSEALSGHESGGRPAFAAKTTTVEDREREDEVGLWLSRHHIRPLSARRVLVERAKRDVISLLRPSAAHASPLSVSPVRSSTSSGSVPRKGAKVFSSDVLHTHRSQK